jgi:hypothetical protein
MTLETALRALSEAESRLHHLEAERTRLALRVKDLEQQLVARTSPRETRPDPAVARQTCCAPPIVCGLHSQPRDKTKVSPML